MLLAGIGELVDEHLEVKCDYTVIIRLVTIGS